MTDLAPAPQLTTTAATRPVAATIAIGVLGGCTLGVVARVWMRLISEDPEFSWSGTNFIVMGFTIFGLGQSIVAAARPRVSARWKLTSIRAAGAMTMLPLFVGAGMLMFPTVVGGGLARSRTEWRPITRGICAFVASAPLLFVGIGVIGSFGWSFRSALGILMMLGVYATIIWATGFTLAAQRDGWHVSRRGRVLAAVGVAALVFLPIASSVGLG